MVVLESSDPEPIEMELDLPVSVVYRGPGGSLVLGGDDHIVIEVLERLFRVSAGVLLPGQYLHGGENGGTLA